MTDFYRFPKMIIDESIGEQFQKIQKEVEETHSVLNRPWGHANINEIKADLGMELMDVIHATETMLRKNFNDEEIECFWTLVKEKNRQRGYYDRKEEDGNSTHM